MRANLVLVSILAAICFGMGGCAKKETDAGASASDAAAVSGGETAPSPSPAPAAKAEGPGKESVPGENAVRSALASKDYQGAVGRLMSMRPSIKPEQWADYVNLQGEVRESLMVAGERDPKAGEALMTLRAFTSGR